MNVTIELSGTHNANELRSLRIWLLQKNGLRGRVNLVARAPTPNQLGPALEAILVALGPGGAATAFTAGLLSWIRHRTSDVSLKLTRSDGSSIELVANRVRELDVGGLQLQIEQIRNVLDAPTLADHAYLHGAEPAVSPQPTDSDSGARYGEVELGFGQRSEIV